MPELTASFPDATAAAPAGRFPVKTSAMCIDQLPPQGMLRLQGALEQASLAAKVLEITGIAWPEPRRYASGDGLTLAWAGPAEWLLFCELDDEAPLLDRLCAAFRDDFVSVTPVSDSRIGFGVSGDAATAFVSKGCAVDLRAEAFGAHSLAITRFAGLTAQLLRSSDGYRVYFDASYRGYLLSWMLDASKEWSFPHLS